MLVLNNQLVVAIKVGNQVLPLGGGQLEELVITETVNQFLPTIEFTFLDQFGLLFSNPSIYDGRVISVAIAASQNDIDSSWKDFVVYPRKVISSQAGFHVSVVGFLNYPSYFLGGSYFSYSGNSSDVAKQIASQTGLKAVVDSTNDNQVWLMTGQSRAKFLKEVCNHAYADTKSAYINFVNRNGELYFVDISKRRSSNPKWVFQVVDSLSNVQPKSNTIYVPDSNFETSFSSDILNASAGYGIVFRQFDYTSGSETLSTPKDYVPFTKYLNLNSEIKGIRFEYHTPNAGNTHKNYALAKFQNFRNRALYSTSVTLGTVIPKMANLFDRAKLIYFDQTSGNTGAVLGGAYFVERIVQTISSSSFIVNYGLVREGIDSTTSIENLEG